MNKKIVRCKISGCFEKHEGLGYCKRHYLKLYRHGDPLATPPMGRVRSGKYIKCLVCGKEKYYCKSLANKGRKHFCSQSCCIKYNTGRKLSPEAISKMTGRILEKSPSWRGGRTISPAGYVLIKYPDHPNAKRSGYVYEHRLVMSNKLGRKLTSEEHIHHVNFKKDDNRISNLIILSNSEHKLLHRRIENSNG